MKKTIGIIALITGLVSCTNGKLCPYTSDITNWSLQVTQDGVSAYKVEQLLQNAVKNKQLDSIAIYTQQGSEVAFKTIQDKDSLAFYISKCKSEGYDTTKTDTAK